VGFLDDAKNELGDAGADRAEAAMDSLDGKTDDIA
jgi:hypothetical protein